MRSKIITTSILVFFIGSGVGATVITEVDNTPMWVRLSFIALYLVMTVYIVVSFIEYVEWKPTVNKKGRIKGVDQYSQRASIGEY